MNKLNNDNRGFSLVELIIVIAILSVMAGVVGYGFSMSNGKPAEECARKLTAVISNARTDTIGKYKNVITVCRKDGKLMVTEEILVRIEDDGTRVRTSRSSTVGMDSVELAYKIGAGGYQVLDDTDAVQLRFDAGSGAVKEEVRIGKTDQINTSNVNSDGYGELTTAATDAYCTGFRISRAGKVWYVKLETLTGRVTASTTP